MSAIARHWGAIRASLANEKLREQRLRYEETAFLPAALEITEKPVSPTARITTWVLLGGLVLTILWLTFGKLDVVASAGGKLQPASNVQLVQPTEQGVVRAILVRDGQRVKKGQPLIDLDPTVSAAEAVQAQKALETATLDAARGRAVLAALDGRPLNFRAPAGTPQIVIDTQVALARAQVAEIRAATATGNADRGAAIAALAEAQLTAKKLEESLPLIDEQIEANEAMLAKGYISKLRVIEMRRQRLAAARDRDVALETAQRARAQLASAGGTRDKNIASARADVLANLTKAESEAKLRAEELAKADRRSSLQRLRSPVDGTIAQLAVHTVGGVVEAAKPIMLIVPRGGALIANVRVLNRDAGGIRRGQPVAIKLEAYPFTRYGTIPGTIQTVSSDAIEDEHLGLVYEARVEIDATPEQLADRDIRMASGMSVTADIRTGRRSILDYLISPIDAARREAAREK